MKSKSIKIKRSASLYKPLLCIHMLICPFLSHLTNCKPSREIKCITIYLLLCNYFTAVYILFTEKRNEANFVCDTQFIASLSVTDAGHNCRVIFYYIQNIEEKV